MEVDRPVLLCICITDNYRRSFRKRSTLLMPSLLGEETTHRAVSPVFAASLRAVGPVRPRTQTGSAAPTQVRFLWQAEVRPESTLICATDQSSPLGDTRDWNETWQTRGESQNIRDSIVYVQITGESLLTELTKGHECLGKRILKQDNCLSVCVTEIFISLEKYIILTLRHLSLF